MFQVYGAGVKLPPAESMNFSVNVKVPTCIARPSEEGQARRAVGAEGVPGADERDARRQGA